MGSLDGGKRCTEPTSNSWVIVSWSEKKKAKIQGKDVYSGSICGKNATFTSRIAKLLKQNRMEGVYERMKTLFSE